jgi:phage-related protein
MNLYFNTERSVFLLDPTLEGMIWYWNSPSNKTTRIPYSSEIIPASYGTRSEPLVSLDRLVLGDGYEQVTEVGLRPVRLNMTVVFAKKRPEVVRALMRFFTGEPNSGSIYDRRPSEYFYFKVPYPWDAEDAEPRKFRCTAFPMEPATYQSNTLTCTFEEFFDP